MTDLAALKELRRLSEAAYDQQRQGLVQLQQEEAGLREELRRLDTLDSAHSATQEAISDMRLLGADLLWQGWCGRAKARLNMELAQVLARKGQEQAKVRKAFGRVEAVKSLLAEEMSARKSQAAAQRLQQAIDQAIFRDQ